MSEEKAKGEGAVAAAAGVDTIHKPPTDFFSFWAYAALTKAFVGNEFGRNPRACAVGAVAANLPIVPTAIAASCAPFASSAPASCIHANAFANSASAPFAPAFYNQISCVCNVHACTKDQSPC